LPLDPAYPDERIQHLVNSTKAKIVLCSSAYTERLTTIADSVVTVESKIFSTSIDGNVSIQPSATTQNAAYVIATSGTTGKPKLTVMEHGNFCMSVRGYAPAIGMNAKKPVRMLQFAAHSFDASILEILTPLMLGGTVCIPDEESRVNNVADVINKMQVSNALLTPTFVRFLEPDMVPTLTTLVLGGEPMTQSCIETWSKINLVNA
jgi:non-ribosomal peptide synthetase component F